MSTKIDALIRYPVKGLSGQSLETVQLKAGQGFPCDRQFGFARPDSGFDPAAPKPLPKSKFYMLARDASLVTVNSEYNEQTGILSIAAVGKSDQFDITTAAGKNDASQFLKTYLTLPDDETPQLYEASPHRFTDVSVVSTKMMNAVSLINLDSVQQLSETIRRTVAPARFRGNILMSGLAPFSELEMVGHQIAIGEARLQIVKRTQRCPATQVDPETGNRDMDVPELLQQHYSHKDMGVYAEVVTGGTIAPGDVVEFL